MIQKNESFETTSELIESFTLIAQQSILNLTSINEAISKKASMISNLSEDFRLNQHDDLHICRRINDDLHICLKIDDDQYDDDLHIYSKINDDQHDDDLHICSRINDDQVIQENANDELIIDNIFDITDQFRIQENEMKNVNFIYFFEEYVSSISDHNMKQNYTISLCLTTESISDFIFALDL